VRFDGPQPWETAFNISPPGAVIAVLTRRRWHAAYWLTVAVEVDVLELAELLLSETAAAMATASAAANPALPNKAPFDGLPRPERLARPPDLLPGSGPRAVCMN